MPPITDREGRRGRVWVVTLTLGLGALRSASVSAQDSTVIRGKVIDPAGSPIYGASVAVTSLPDSGVRRTVTDTRGDFAVSFPRAVARVVAAATYPGFVTRRVELAVDRSLATMPLLEIRLERPVVLLPAVTSTAQRPRAQRADQATTDLGPGTSWYFPNSLDLVNGLSGDLTGDIGSALATLTNVSVDPTARGGLSSISAFGLSGGENAATLNGMSFGGSSVPPDGFTLQAVTSTYDAGKGGFGGLNASLRFASGHPESQRSIRATLDAPQLQWGAAPGAGLSSRLFRGIVSGQAAGGIGAGEHFLYRTSAQVVRSETRRATLPSAGPSTLASFGLSPASLQKLLETMSVLGIPGAAGDFQTHSTKLTAFARMDYRPEAAQQSSRGSLETGFSSADDQFTLLAGVSTDDALNGSAASSLSAARTRTSSRHLMLAGTASRYLFGWMLNEFSLSAQQKVTAAGPDVDLPAASLRLAPTATTGAAFSTIPFAGTGAGHGTTREAMVELRNETAWNTSDLSHQFKVTIDGILRSSRAIDPPVFGAFTYHSLDDLAANQPVMFSRSLATPSVSSSAMNAAIGIGDIYSPLSGQPSRPQPRIQYGLRAEADWLLAKPLHNEVLASSLGVETNRVPRAFSLEPMVGLSAPIGRMPRTAGVSSRNRGTIFGGMRAYRSALSPSALFPKLRQPGLTIDPTQFVCTGPAVPRPDWTAFVESPAAIPSRCSDGAAPTFSDRAPSVSVFAPGYRVTRSWRGELGAGGFLVQNTWGSAQITRVRNLGMSDEFDRNFDPTVRFTLSAEANRPIYIAPTAIDPSTGLVLPGASRRSPLFGQVMETGSALEQHLWQASGMLSRTFGALSELHVYSTHTLSYTFRTGSEDVRGFSSSTAGDPRSVERVPISHPRHAASYAMSMSVPRWGKFAGQFGVTSPARFTPRVLGDLNGDGLSNDRPFIFDPDQTADPELRSGMRHLLSSAPRTIRRCLEENLGRIAARGICSTPPRASLNISVTPNPYRLRLGNRGSLSILATNVLGGLDALMHGQSRMRGWGAAATPDATLLAVRGFDPATRRFAYAVNPAFGTTSAARSTLSTPFTITMSLRIDLGPDAETRALNTFFASAQSAAAGTQTPLDIRARLTQWSASSRLAVLLRMRDSLHLSGDQAASIGRIAEVFHATRDSAYDALALVLAARRGDYRGDSGRREWHETLAAVALASRDAWDQVRSLLTAEQYALVPLRWKGDDGVSRAILEDRLRRPIAGPTP